MSTIESIDLHVRTYRSALKSTLEVTINSLQNYHLKSQPLLHPLGSKPNQIDLPALIYSIQRLPSQIDKTKKILIGQTPEIFAKSGFPTVTSWPKVTALARRRTIHFHSDQKIMAVFAASISDIDDLVNLLLAYQIEWNKFYRLARYHYPKSPLFLKALKDGSITQKLNLDPDEWNFFLKSLGSQPQLRLHRLYRKTQNLRLRLLAGSWIDYTKTTNLWYHHLNRQVVTHTKKSLYQSSIYFVSSNLHSLLNISTGFALKNQKSILSHLSQNHPDLLNVWHKIQKQEFHLHPSDFLYYASRFMPSSYHQNFQKYQQKLKIDSVPSSHYLDVNTQIIPLSTLIKSPQLDPRLKISQKNKILNSNSLIINIDYPLGFDAYHILQKMLENVGHIKGVYVLGKAAVLNGEIGDIQIPRLVFDEHSQNTYIFQNCFNSFFPFTNQQGSVLTNQKAVSVLGTFLQNEALIEKYSKNNLTVIEMESGPYLAAITEATYDTQGPKNTIIDLNSAPLDIGIINYTSDTPYSRFRSLGVSNLTLNGVEPVYLGSLTILQRIINQEEATD